ASWYSNLAMNSFVPLSPRLFAPGAYSPAVRRIIRHLLEKPKAIVVPTQRPRHQQAMRRGRDSEDDVLTPRRHSRQHALTIPPVVRPSLSPRTLRISCVPQPIPLQTPTLLEAEPPASLP